jgi:hypothetical protein
MSLRSLLQGRHRSLQAGYEEALGAAFEAQPLRPAAPLADPDLAHLPAPVQRYLRRSGAVGRPRPQNVRIEFAARMWSKPGAAPMAATSVQHNFFADPTRLFHMKARMFGFPVQVFHAYAREQATMRVRVAWLVDLVDLSGDELSTGETVTLLNDMCFFAPGALVDPRLLWTPLDERTAAVTFVNGRRRVAARVHFNERDELVDFTSDDRAALLPDGTLRRHRWSTPVDGYREIGGRWVGTHGVAVYAYPEGDFTYGDFTVRSVAWDVTSPAGP